jgi:predicted nucleic acid-binding protein
MIVLDASVVVEILLATHRGQQLAWRLLRRTASLHVPHLLDLEVTQVLRRYLASGELTEERAKEGLDVLRGLALARYPHDLLLGRIWELRANATAYDAAYLALAEALDATLLTCDERLARAPGHRARVELVAEAV